VQLPTANYVGMFWQDGGGRFDPATDRRRSVSWKTVRFFGPRFFSWVVQHESSSANARCAGFRRTWLGVELDVKTRPLDWSFGLWKAINNPLADEG